MKAFHALPGRLLLLWFFPRARTPGCAVQADDLVDAHPDFEDNGLDVVGLSLEPQERLTAWADDLLAPFPIVSVSPALAGWYGALRDEGDPWRDLLAKRVAVVVDEAGEVVASFHVSDPHDFPDQVRAALRR